MPDRIKVSGPRGIEEYRLLAEVIAELDHVMSIIVENAKELIPGESVEDLTMAWIASRESMKALVRSIFDSEDANQQGTLARSLEEGMAPTPPFVDLQGSALIGEAGKLKRSLMTRLRDVFFMFWNSEPRTDEKRARAANAARDYLEVGTTVVGSIPGGDKVIEVISLAKQLIGIRSARGV